MSGHVLPCLIMPGHEWSCLAMSGHFRPCPVVSGHARLCPVTSGLSLYDRLFVCLSRCIYVRLSFRPCQVSHQQIAYEADDNAAAEAATPVLS